MKRTTRKNPYAFKSAKMERQYQELRKRFRLTRAEFAEYYQNVRKANVKGQRLKKQADALITVNYSLEVHHILTRAEFTKYKKSVNKVLERDYRKRSNLMIRERLYNNLGVIYTYDADKLNNLIGLLNLMTDAELQQFLKENKDIQPVAYDSDPIALIAYFETIGLTIEKFSNRIIKKL